MNVTQILYSGLGGHGSVAFSLTEAAGSNWENSMVFAGIEPLLPEYEERCREFGFPWRSVRTRPGGAMLSWPAIHASLKALSPDAIILHSVKMILPAALYAKRRGVPLIAVEHQPNALKKRSEWWVGRLLMEVADAVVLLTPEYAQELRAGLGRSYRSEMVHVIPNGIDTGFFRPKVDKRPGELPMRIGMAARFSGTKRQDLLVGALHELVLQDGPGSWRLSLAGDGETRAQVERLVDQYGASEWVDLPGFLKGEELRDWFQSLDLYAHASEGETLSTSLIQAMATGLPIVGSNVEGLRNLLSLGGGCGVLAQEQTPHGLASALRMLAENQEKRTSVMQNARRLAEERFSHSAMYEAYRNVLKTCLSGRSSI